MDRKTELIMREYGTKASKFLSRIQKFYSDRKEQPDLQVWIRIPNLMLYFQNKAITREFLEMTRQTEMNAMTLPIDTHKVEMADAKYAKFKDLMDAIDIALAEVNPSNDVITEMFLILSITRSAINTIALNPPKIDNPISTGG